MKHLLTTLCLGLILGSGQLFTAQATDFESGVLKYTILHGDSVAVAGYAFEEDTPDVVVPSTVTYAGQTYKVTEIARAAFQGNTDIRSLVVPESVETVGGYSFTNSTLASLTIAEGCKYLGDRCFMNTKIETFTIPSTVTTIREYVFSGTNLKSVYVPGTVDFSTSTQRGIWKSCKELKTVTLAEGITRIPDRAFADCINLEEVNLPSTLTQIDVQAFIAMDLNTWTGVGLGYPILPLEHFKTLNCAAVNPPTLGTNVFDSLPTTAVIKVPTASVDAYKAAAGWNLLANQIVGDKPLGVDETLVNADNAVETIYNLQGMKVNRADMGHGLYIINGKKVMVK